MHIPRTNNCEKVDDLILKKDIIFLQIHRAAENKAAFNKDYFYLNIKIHDRVFNVKFLNHCFYLLENFISRHMEAILIKDKSREPVTVCQL